MLYFTLNLQPRPKRQYIRRKPLASKKPEAPPPEPPPDPYAFIDDEDLPSTSTNPLSLSQGMLDFSTHMSPGLDLTQSAPSSLFDTGASSSTGVPLGSDAQDTKQEGPGRREYNTHLALM